MVNSYRNHPSVIKIKQVVNGSDISESERSMKMKLKTFSEI